MAMTSVISQIATSFVYEDLISRVQNILQSQYSINKKVENELKSRSSSFVDPYVNQTNNMDKIKEQIKTLRQFTDIELKLCIMVKNLKPNKNNWINSTLTKSNDTIMSLQLYENQYVLLGKLINNKIPYYQIFVKTLT
ncbi:hypothetical protein I4U23_005415 [Adineta vaga]|nr:hypothetical protein I4U23_005415 [Adineta vaga]